MASIYDWSTTAANNGTADADTPWPEGMARRQVNDSARNMMKRNAELLGDIGGALSAGGTANGLTVTANSAFTTYADGRIVAFRATADNTGAATLNVNGIGAKAIRKMDTTGEVALGAGDIKNTGIYVAQYSAAMNGAAGAWLLVNPTISSLTLNSLTMTSTDAGASVGPVLTLYRNSATPAASDALGQVLFDGEDSAGNQQTYADIRTIIADPTSGAEYGQVLIRNVVSGTLTTQITLSTTGVQIPALGASTPGTGAFTTLTSTGGAFNGTVGATTPAAGTFTTLTASGDVTAENFVDASNFAVLANDGTSGGVILRPNGKSSTTGQLQVASSGAISANGTITTTGNIVSGQDVTSSITQLRIGPGSAGTIDLRPNTVGSLTGAVSIGTGGTTFSAGITATTGTFSGAVSMTALTATTGTFSGAVSGTTVSASTAFRAAAGSAGTPALSFTGDTNTGLYSYAADEIGITIGGAFLGNFTASGFNLGKDAQNAATAGVSLGEDGQGLFTVAADTCQIWNRTGADGTICQIRNDNVTVGTIEVAGAATNYNTSSDGRLKKNLRDFNSGGFIDALEVWLFDWKSGGSGYGVIAQDAHKVFPDAISYDDGLDLWTADYSKFVPLLLAEVKALRARVAALEA